MTMTIKVRAIAEENLRFPSRERIIDVRATPFNRSTLGARLAGAFERAATRARAAVGP